MINIAQLFTSKGLNTNEIVLSITSEEAFSDIVAALDYCGLANKVNFEQFTATELQLIFTEYAYTYAVCHNESYHQARAAILTHFSIFERCGLSTDDYYCVDFS